MRTFRVCLELTQVELGHVEIEANDEAEALRLADELGDDQVAYNYVASVSRRVVSIEEDAANFA